MINIALFQSQIEVSESLVQVEMPKKTPKCLEIQTAVEKGQEEEGEGRKLMVVCLCIFFVSFLKHGEGNEKL